MSLKILTVVGARPQFIKSATLSRVIAARNEVTEVIVHTGQHYDQNMSDVFFEELDIPRPDYHLEVGSGSHGVQTGQMLARLEETIQKEAPEVVLVYGDTNSTLAGALAASKLHVPLAHVEAGLRSFNRRMPEEVNRIVADVLSTFLYVPTEAARINLRNEGVPDARVLQFGDVMFDAALYYGERAETGALKSHSLNKKAYVLVTIHRAENTDNLRRLEVIFSALSKLAEEMDLVLPIHPRTRAVIQAAGLEVGRVKLIDPVGYLDMVALERDARLILTDSGGVQKEAYFHRVPCVTLRDETEWVELVDLGWNRLAPPVSAQSILSEVTAALAHQPGDAESPYGSGDAADRIVEHLVREFGQSH